MLFSIHREKDIRLFIGSALSEKGSHLEKINITLVDSHRLKQKQRSSKLATSIQNLLDAVVDYLPSVLSACCSLATWPHTGFQIAAEESNKT